MTTLQILSAWLDERIMDLIDVQQEIGLRASGFSARSLRKEVEETADRLVGRIVDGSGYVYYQIYGRRPGKFPPVQAIRNWIDQKGIQVQDISKDSLAYLIARKIAREGIRVPNPYNPGTLFSRVFTQEALADLQAEIGRQQAVELQQSIALVFPKVA